MTFMNVVHMRVKPGKEAEFVAIHQEFDARAMPGGRNFWVVASSSAASASSVNWTLQISLPTTARR